MRTLIVSDLHLGSPSLLPGADGALADLLTRDWGQVILLGDVFDLWAAPYKEAIQKHGVVMAALEEAASSGTVIVYVPGNHDDAFKGLDQFNKFQVSGPDYRFCSGGKWITCVHGDEYDSLEGPVSRIGAWLSRVVDKIAQWISGPGVSITRKVRTSFAEMGGGREKYVRPLHERVAGDVSSDYIVVGHTHVPTQGEEINGSIVVGCGDFGPEHMTYVTVENGQVELHGV